MSMPNLFFIQTKVVSPYRQYSFQARIQDQSAQSHVVSYQYDSLGRLTTRYTYDAAGRLATRKV
jgi:hypothetical protein